MCGQARSETIYKRISVYVLCRNILAPLHRIIPPSWRLPYLDQSNYTLVPWNTVVCNVPKVGIVSVLFFVLFVVLLFCSSILCNYTVEVKTNLVCNYNETPCLCNYALSRWFSNQSVVFSACPAHFSSFTSWSAIYTSISYERVKEEVLWINK